MKQCLAWMVVLFLITEVPGFAQKAEPIHGWLHTRGQRVVDKEGRDVRFCGVNLSGLEWGAGAPWSAEGCATPSLGCYSLPPPEAVRTIAGWGFNMIRLPVAWSNLEPDPPEHRNGKLIRRYNTPYLEAVDKLIAQCKANGLAVVLSFHQWGWSPAFHLPKSGTDEVVHGCGLPAWLYAHDTGDVAQARRDFFAGKGDVQAGVAEAWMFLARRYANDLTVVGADLFNEPDATDYARGKIVKEFELDDFYQALGEAVRSVNSHILLIVEEGRGTHLAKAPRLQDVVYSFHDYPHGWGDKADDWTKERMARAARWNVPVWVGEFQRIGPTGQAGDPNGLDPTRRMLEYFKKQGAGWAYWAFDRAARPLNGGSGKGPADEPLVHMLRGAF